MDDAAPMSIPTPNCRVNIVQKCFERYSLAKLMSSTPKLLALKVVEIENRLSTKNIEISAATMP